MKKPKLNWLQAVTVRATRFHFLYVSAFMISLVVFDSWNLIAHEAIVKFWTAAAALLALNAVCWYICRINFSSDKAYILTLQLLVLADIIFAAMVVYWERGMASSSVILFTVPLLLSGVLQSRSMLLTTAALSVAAYSTAVVKYFYENYGEGFRVELYGEIFLYGALFFIFAAFIHVINTPRQTY